MNTAVLLGHYARTWLSKNTALPRGKEKKEKKNPLSNSKLPTKNAALPDRQKRMRLGIEPRRRLRAPLLRKLIHHAIKIRRMR